MSYGDNQYGGGGASNSYYNNNEDFSGRNNNNSYGGSGGGYGSNEGYGNQNQGYGNNNNNSYGGSGGGYGSNEGYGNQNQGNYGRQESHGGYGHNDDNDFSGAAVHAQEHHSNEDTSLFSSALNFLKDRKNDDNDVDEEKAANAHQAMYGSGSSNQQHDSNTVGAGAAMQALKMFAGGNESSGSSGGMDKNKLIGLAMAQAGKLWDEKNGSGGNVVCYSCSFDWG
jgi:hypothetical protein